MSSGLWFAVALALWTLTILLASLLKHRTGWPDFYEIERQRRERERLEWEREQREWERALAVFRGGKSAVVDLADGWRPRQDPARDHEKAQWVLKISASPAEGFFE